MKTSQILEKLIDEFSSLGVNSVLSGYIRFNQNVIEVGSLSIEVNYHREDIPFYLYEKIEYIANSYGVDIDIILQEDYESYMDDSIYIQAKLPIEFNKFETENSQTNFNHIVDFNIKFENGNKNITVGEINFLKFIKNKDFEKEVLAINSLLGNQWNVSVPQPINLKETFISEYNTVKSLLDGEKYFNLDISLELSTMRDFKDRVLIEIDAIHPINGFNLMDLDRKYHFFYKRNNLWQCRDSITYKELSKSNELEKDLIKELLSKSLVKTEFPFESTNRYGNQDLKLYFNRGTIDRIELIDKMIVGFNKNRVVFLSNYPFENLETLKEEINKLLCKLN